MPILVSSIYVEDVLVELKKYVSRKTDLIADTAGMNAAIAFIGTSLQNGEPAFRYIDPSRVDLRRFPITKTFIDALAFIIHPYSGTLMKGEDVKKLKSFMAGIPRVEAEYERYPMQPLEGLCRIIADTAYARYKLEVARRGKFSVRELMLLAETSEGAVRRALNQKGASRLSAMPYTKSVRIEYVEAKRWLSAQPGFKSSWASPTGHPNLREMLAVT